MKIIICALLAITVSACIPVEELESIFSKDYSYTNGDAIAELTNKLVYPETVVVGEEKSFTVNLSVDTDTAEVRLMLVNVNGDIFARGSKSITLGTEQDVTVNVVLNSGSLISVGDYQINIRLCAETGVCDSSDASLSYYSNSSSNQGKYKLSYFLDGMIEVVDSGEIPLAIISIVEDKTNCSPDVDFRQMTTDERNLTYSCYRMSTTYGNIDLAINKMKAPLHAENFAFYVKHGHYEGTIFHRVIRDYLIQGGGLTEDLEEKQTFDSVEIESDNGLSNKRCTLAAARADGPDSAKSQFHINVVDNSRALDYKASVEDGWGYTVFGHVVNGMSVVDYIREVPTGDRSNFRNVPLTNIVISSVDPIACEAALY